MAETTKTSKKYQNNFIFEYLKNILVTKSMKIYEEHVSDVDNFNSFPNLVIMRYLSMSPDINVRNVVSNNQITIERLDKLGHRYTYKWYIDNIPKQKTSFITYIK